MRVFIIVCGVLAGSFVGLVVWMMIEDEVKKIYFRLRGYAIEKTKSGHIIWKRYKKRKRRR